MSVVIPLLLVIHVAICLLMVLVVLMQRPRSEGLGAAFGGGMTDNIFGAQTTHVLQKFTVYLGIGFFALTLLLAILFSKATAGSTLLERELLSGADSTAPAAVESPTPVATSEPAAPVEPTPSVPSTVPVEAAAPSVSEPTPVAPEVPAQP